MGRVKHWLYNKFLPAWCKEDLLEANARLLETVEAQGREIQRLRAYIGGLERGIRAQRNIVIKGGGAIERLVRDLSQSGNG